MRVAVTGAHGFLGAATTTELLGQGEEVRALVTPWANLDRLSGLNPLLFRVDLKDGAGLSEALAGCDAVIHLAATVRDWGPAGPFEEVNVLGTGRLLAAAERAGVSRFVHVSSVAVHRYSGYFGADPESAPLDGVINAYARSKVQAEQLVRASPLNWVIVRPGLWPYGEGDPNLLRVAAALRTGTLPLVAAGRARLNTVYSGNLAHGLHLALRAGTAVRRTVVVADEGAPDWQELFAEIARLQGARPPRLSLPPAVVRFAGSVTEAAWRLAAPRREPPLTRYRASLMQADMHFSIEPARALLGYTPRIGWREGLRRSLKDAG